MNVTKRPLFPPRFPNQKLLLGHVAVALLSFALLSFCQTTPKKTADQIVDANIKAVGGGRAWLNLKSVYEKGHWKGTWVIFVRTLAEFPADDPFELRAERPGKLFVTFETRQGQRTNICDGNGNASVKGPPFGLTQVKAAGSVARWCGGPLVLDSLLWRGLAWKVSLKGHTKIHGSEAWILQVSLPTGGSELHYFDARTGLRVRSELEPPLCGLPLGIPIGNAGFKCVVDYSDYRDVNGLKFPFKISSHPSIAVEKEATTIIDEVLVNIPIDETVFGSQTPAGKANQN